MAAIKHGVRFSNSTQQNVARPRRNTDGVYYENYIPDVERFRGCGHKGASVAIAKAGVRRNPNFLGA